jgi:hypothetical protein
VKVRDFEVINHHLVVAGPPLSPLQESAPKSPVTAALWPDPAHNWPAKDKSHAEDGSKRI